MNTLLPTTIVGSYPQPEWLIDKEKIKVDTVKVIENEFVSGEYIHEGEVIGIIDVLNIVTTYKFKG